ncbi:uncharacterized protein C8R40DRAFT_437583 [Lentinula edodes]|uniref:uncharacterized protein n=1 Tax=Lentinula edodes TaxID=5353 RepID=UPI001E8D69B7|nr:uncharacterized protein C8R40DRAFT_437583 [Lentinula edodes]KAH7879645.1 hypothetical protein C8R40DRAFT_437583 [Lentinula edodes]
MSIRCSEDCWARLFPCGTPSTRRSRVYIYLSIYLCLACRYEAPGVPATEPRAYSKWFSGSDQDISGYKNTFLTSPFVLAQGLPIQPYFADFEPWLNLMHQFVSEGYHARPRPGIDVSAYPGLKKHLPSKTLFDWQTLDGNVTYSVLRQFMSSFQKEPLDTRWTGFNPDN